MALTDLADVIAASQQRFSETVVEESTKVSRFWMSGAVVGDPLLAGFSSGPGKLFTIPVISDIPDTESNPGDDTENAATPEALTGTRQDARKHFRNKPMKAADLAAALGDIDPIGVAIDRFAAYWRREYESFLVATIRGILADNIANDSSDMVHVVATDAAGAPTAGELFSADNVIDAEATAGDMAAEEFGIIVMHSVVFHNARKLNLIDDIPDARGEVMFQRYHNKMVVVSDNMPAIAGSNRITYTTAILGRGTFGFEAGMPKVPVEIDRAPLEGNGEGTETIVNRTHFILHPYGFSWQENTVSGDETPTNADLILAANWDRTFARKNIRMAFLQTNG